MEYTELSCTVEPSGEGIEILMALLAEEGFEMFEERDGILLAYIPTPNFDSNIVERLSQHEYLPGFSIGITFRHVPDENWNATWEANFQPVRIADQIYIRAEYHEPDPGYPHELIVHPRMAFGTGHHATTSLMLERMLDMKLESKSLLDMGCGTGILAIMAIRLGAGPVTAIDIDPNSVENTILNSGVNQVAGIRVLEGGAGSIKEMHFDVILANINRNIILEDLPVYVSSMKPEGVLLTSGYYSQDLDAIRDAAANCGLKYVSHELKDNWCCALFVR